MDDFIQGILKKVEQLYSRIEEKRKLIVLYGMICNIEKYNAIFTIQVIINQCLQCGNYRRSYRYMVLLEHLVNDFEKNENIIKDEVTNYFVKDNLE